MNFFDQTNSILSDVPLGLKWLSWESALMLTIYSLIRFTVWCRELPKRFHAGVLRIGYRLGVAYVWVMVRVANWYAYRFVQIDQRGKCPACGVRQLHKVHFEATVAVGGKPGVVIHDCENCTASWGEPPLVPMEKWLKLSPSGGVNVRE